MSSCSLFWGIRNKEKLISIIVLFNQRQIQGQNLIKWAYLQNYWTDYYQWGVKICIINHFKLNYYDYDATYGKKQKAIFKGEELLLWNVYKLYQLDYFGIWKLQ